MQSRQKGLVGVNTYAKSQANNSAAKKKPTLADTIGESNQTKLFTTLGISNLAAVDIHSSLAFKQTVEDDVTYTQVVFKYESGRPEFSKLKGVIVKNFERIVVGPTYFTGKGLVREIPNSGEIRLVDYERGLDKTINLNQGRLRPGFQGFSIRVWKQNNIVHLSSVRAFDANLAIANQSETTEKNKSFRAMFEELGGDAILPRLFGKKPNSPWVHTFLVSHPSVVNSSTIDIGRGFIAYIDSNKAYEPESAEAAYEEVRLAFDRSMQLPSRYVIAPDVEDRLFSANSQMPFNLADKYLKHGTVALFSRSAPVLPDNFPAEYMSGDDLVFTHDDGTLYLLRPESSLFREKILGNSSAFERELCLTLDVAIRYQNPNFRKQTNSRAEFLNHDTIDVDFDVMLRALQRTDKKGKTVYLGFSALPTAVPENASNLWNSNCHDLNSDYFATYTPDLIDGNHGHQIATLRSRWAIAALGQWLCLSASKRQQHWNLFSNTLRKMDALCDWVVHNINWFEHPEQFDTVARSPFREKSNRKAIEHVTTLIQKIRATKPTGRSSNDPSSDLRKGMYTRAGSVVYRLMKLHQAVLNPKIPSPTLATKEEQIEA